MRPPPPAACAVGPPSAWISPAPESDSASMRMLPPAPPPLFVVTPFASSLPSRTMVPAVMRATPPPALHDVQVPFCQKPPEPPGVFGSKRDPYVAADSPLPS